MNPPATAATTTTPNETGISTLARARVRRPRNKMNQLAIAASAIATKTSQLARGWRFMMPPVAGIPAGPGRRSHTSSEVTATIPAPTATALTISARLWRCGTG
jgi:hypothetical protein